MIENRHLHAFIVLAEKLHFGRAAEKLNIAQSALSTQIMRLEDMVGTPLLVRNRRSHPTLTPAGHLFLEEARNILAHVERASRLTRLTGLGEGGPVHIGYVFSAAICGLVPSVLRHLHARFPLLEITPHLMETPDQIAAIADARLTLGFVRPRPVYPEAIMTRFVHSEDIVIALPLSHRLADAPSLRAADLAGETFIVPQFHEKFGLIDNLIRLAQAGGFPPPPTHTTSDFITALCMAAGGRGIVLAPASLRKLSLAGIVFRELTDFHDQVQLTLAWRSGTPDSLIREIVTHLESP
ncbi:LysR family transcriptional regulator [Acetobacter musti]|uniref:LysR family transcriptional regulator n=1 Tax=Acetobacter musti TaxID=864732 RepID=A0ABX0JLY8_9PROT|nr:LysR family transcriptional regulator [Acetobacter musti]NHN83758.1 LysR family transcriptional regulator [Acetobacter musti]